jgi:hypothetical protein
VAALIIGFIAPAIRLLFRLIRRAELIPEAHVREAPVISTLVFLACVLGSLLLLLVVWILLTTSPEERHGANLAAPISLGLMFFAFALLTGECVLVGRSAKRPARSSAAALK